MKKRQKNAVKLLIDIEHIELAHLFDTVQGLGSYYTVNGGYPSSRTMAPFLAHCCTNIFYF